MDPKPAEGEEQAKKRRGRKKSKLEDMFPAYLQVCILSFYSVVSTSIFTFFSTFVFLSECIFVGGFLWEDPDRFVQESCVDTPWTEASLMPCPPFITSTIRA